MSFICFGQDSPKTGIADVEKPAVPEILLEKIDDFNFVPESKSVTTEQGKILAWSIGADTFIQCSAKTGEGKEKLKETIGNMLTTVDHKKKWRRLSKLVSI